MEDNTISNEELLFRILPIRESSKYDDSKRTLALPYQVTIIRSDIRSRSFYIVEEYLKTFFEIPINILLLCIRVWLYYLPPLRE